MKEYEISATMEDDLCSVDILLFVLAPNKKDAIKKAKKRINKSLKFTGDILPTGDKD